MATNPNVQAAANLLARGLMLDAHSNDRPRALANRLEADGLLAHPGERVTQLRDDVRALLTHIVQEDATSNASPDARLRTVLDSLAELVDTLGDPSALHQLGTLGDPSALHQLGTLAAHALKARRGL